MYHLSSICKDKGLKSSYTITAGQTIHLLLDIQRYLYEKPIKPISVQNAIDKYKASTLKHYRQYV